MGRPARFLDKLTAINIRLKGAHLILPKVERMLGASGLVPLSPLFSSEIVRFSFQMPACLKLHGGVEKIVLKRAYADQLPPEVIDRPKGYFPVPALKYLDGEYLEFVRDALAHPAARERELFRDDYLNRLMDEPKKHITPLRGSKVWQIALLEIWLQQHGI